MFKMGDLNKLAYGHYGFLLKTWQFGYCVIKKNHQKSARKFSLKESKFGIIVIVIFKRRADIFVNDVGQLARYRD